MARATRIALDLALVSLRTVGPVVSNIWLATKRLLISTPAKPLVCNPLIRRAETAFDQIASLLVSKIKTLRDRQLPEEKKYLEKELEKVKKKIDQNGDSASKSLKPGCATAWRYAKVEMIPPMTQGFFHGAGGKKLEDYMSKLADNFIAGIEGRIREIEAEKVKQIKAREAAIKAAQDRAMAEAKKREELRLKEEAVKKTQEAKKAKEKTDNVEKKPAVKAQEKPDAKPATKAEGKTEQTKVKAGEKVTQKRKKIKKKEVKKPKGRGKSKNDGKTKK